MNTLVAVHRGRVLDARLDNHRAYIRTCIRAITFIFIGLPLFHDLRQRFSKRIPRSRYNLESC